MLQWQNAQFRVELLDPWLGEYILGFLNSSQQEMFQGKVLVSWWFDRESHKNFCHKIFHYMERCVWSHAFSKDCLCLLVSIQAVVFLLKAGMQCSALPPHICT